MTKKKTTSSNRKTNQTISTIVIVGGILLFAFFMLTGNDPLGLFSNNENSTNNSSHVTTMVGSGGDWWQVYFTDPAPNYDPDNMQGTVAAELINHINNAQESIHIASFEFNLTPVAEALIAAHKRGVDVRWVTDDENGIEADEEEGHGQFAMLEKAGIEVVDDARGALMHNKFWIFDGQTVWTGSTNITENGIFRNNNNVIVVESPAVAAMFEREFAEMWDGEFGPRSPSTLDQQSTTIQGTPVEILFAAEDEVMDELIPLINQARSNIKFMAFSFTHEGLGEAMLAKAADGVAVSGIFETRGSETEYSELSNMVCANLAVRQDGNPGTFHHKVIIIDDRIVITGSLNFSDNANDSNDENVIIINNADIAQQYLQEFQRRWQEGKTPSPADMGC
ncbi:MAG: phospholipase [Anaerolineae bacterium]|nr:phospholipase [Anaerolineae bacterium]